MEPPERLCDPDAVEDNLSDELTEAGNGANGND